MTKPAFGVKRWTLHYRDAEATTTIGWPDGVNREPGWVVIEHRSGADPYGPPTRRKFIPADRIKIIEEVPS